jgi:phosphoenolpyruvate carboxylase
MRQMAPNLLLHPGMTCSVAGVLGAYLLAKHAGLFLDAAGVETCTLPIVPLFETIGSLRRRLIPLTQVRL